MSARQAVSTKHFTIESYEQGRTEQFLADHADEIAQGVAALLGFPLRAPVTVIVAPDEKTFQKSQPAGARVPGWAVGVAYPQRDLIVLLKKPRSDILKTFQHEVSHILLGQAFGRGHQVPRWLDEGLAIIMAGEWTMGRLSAMTFAVLTDRLIPMEALSRGFPADASRAELAYCQSFYFISFLKAKFGDAEFQNFINVYSSCKDFKQAIWKAYYLHWYEMEDLWLDYLHLRFSWIPLITSTGTLWFLASLVFVWGYLSKKRAARQKLRQWELEEMLMSDEGNSPTRH